MNDESEIVIEPEETADTPMQDVPSYVFLPEPFKTEARRAYVLSTQISVEGFLDVKWRENIADIDAWLAAGIAPSAGHKAGGLKSVKG